MLINIYPILFTQRLYESQARLKGLFMFKYEMSLPVTIYKGRNLNAKVC
jgi:hypothetical protein